MLNDPLEVAWHTKADRKPDLEAPGADKNKINFDQIATSIQRYHTESDISFLMLEKEV